MTMSVPTRTRTSPKAPRKRAVFVVSAGGTGKSYFVRALLDRHRRTDRSCAAYDCDGETGSLSLVYGMSVAGRDANPRTGVAPIKIHEEEQRNLIFKAPYEKADTLLFDIPGGQMWRLVEPFIQARIENGLEKPREYPVGEFASFFAAAGYDVTVVVTISNHEKSILCVAEALRMFGQSVNFVAVKNLFFEQFVDDFIQWDGGEIAGKHIGGRTKEELLERGGRIIVMPALSQGVISLVQALRLRFEQGRNDPRLRMLDRSRIMRWQDEMDRQFDLMGDWLGLSQKNIKQGEVQS